MSNLFTPRKGTDWLVVHCSATPASMNIGRKEIEEWHRAKGWVAIGYHYVIRRDGTVETGRPSDVIGAHVEGHNKNSIGICLVGGVNKAMKPEDNFTASQFAALGGLLHMLKAKYPDAAIQGHRDFPNVHKACPSFDVKAWLKANPI